MQNNRNHNSHFYRLLLIATILFAVGIILVIVGCYSNKSTPGNVGALLALNFGGIVCIGSSYALVSELFLKKNFAKELRASIDQNLEQTALNRSIGDFGLHSIKESFELSSLWQRIEKSDSVLMVAMRNNTFFKTYSDDIVSKILNDNVKFTFILLNPESSTISSLEKKFSDEDEETIKRNIQNTIHILIKENIYDKLPPDKKSNIVVRLFDEIPVYSAYVFDNEEIWYIPFHYRHNRKPIPVFIMKDKELFRSSQLLKDLMELQSDTLSVRVEFEQV